MFLFGFANFIACGSAFYSISLEDDSDMLRSGTSNPDYDNPEADTYGIHAPSGWRKLPIRYRFGTQLNDEQRKHLSQAMKIWEAAVGMPLFEVSGLHEGHSGDGFQDLYSSLSDGVNGHYLDQNWGKTKKPQYVLATTIWNGPASGVISTADIRFNAENYIIGDSLRLRATESKEVVDMQSLALHELGHLLGLAHVSESIDGLSIMNPTLFIGEGLISREISKGDIERIQKIYGCDGAACDIDQVVETVRAFERQHLTDPMNIAH